MTHQPRTTLLVNASVLQDLLAKHPEIEIELVKNASAQVAEVFKNKVTSNTGTLRDRLVDDLIRDINAKLNYKYHLPEAALKAIREACMDHVRNVLEKTANTDVSKALDDAVERYARKAEHKLDALITAAVEKKVAAVFAAAARLK